MFNISTATPDPDVFNISNDAVGIVPIPTLPVL
jgi:hypothetical protein